MRNYNGNVDEDANQSSDDRPPAAAEALIQVVVLIVCYNGRNDIEACVESVLASADAQRGLDVRVVVVDNASPDGCGDFVAGRFGETVDLVRCEKNRGFTGGNNAGWSHARKQYPQARYIALLNQDTEVAPHWLQTLVAKMEADEQVAAVQSKLLLHPAIDRINTVGNRCHYLGFGFMTGYDEVDAGQWDQPRPIDFASAAAMLIRRSVLEQIGLFDEAMFLYLEDAELSWKLRQMGLQVWYEPASVVYHKYQPTAPFKHYYYLERNRWLLLLTYYRLPTLVLLLPALLFMELGQWAFAITHGCVGQKLRSYGYFLRPSRWRRLWRRRRETQQRRRISDRAFMGDYAGRITFAVVDGPLLRWVGNPLLNAYWRAARQLVLIFDL